MCMEDIRIGRKLNSQLRTKTIAGGTASLLVGGNPKRVAIDISTDGTAVAWIGTRDYPPSAVSGLTLPTQRPEKQLRIEDHGNVVTGEIFVFHAAGNVGYTYIESILEDQ